jgi:hypothetical protein
MALFTFIKQYAEQIGGQFTDYDHTKAVVVVPLANDRFQTVLAINQKSAKTGRDMVIFTSRVCEYSNGIDLKNLLEHSAAFDYSRFILEDNFLKVEASSGAGTSEDQAKEMIQEVANLADEYEHLLTGKDIH